MIRFILNFIFYGIIFFLIWKFQPEWIETMRVWAQATYELVVDLGSFAIEKVQELSSGAAKTAGGQS